MTIRVDLTNKDNVPLYIEQDGEHLRMLQPGESGTVYVKRDMPITLRGDLRGVDRFEPSRPLERRQQGRRFMDRRRG